MNVPKTEHKITFLKRYNKISELEQALIAVRQMNFNRIAISVIGNLGDDNMNASKEPELNENELQLFFRKLLGENTDFDTFYNPELGHLFVAGSLVATFLNPIGKSTIGVLSGGPYGILRGLGVSESEAVVSIKKLGNGTYLFVVRGDQLDIEKLENKLKIDKTN